MQGISDFIQSKRRGVRNPSYGVTPLGKTKVEQYTTNNSDSVVMQAIIDNGNVSTINELSSVLNVSPKRIKRILDNLIANGYVRRTGVEG